MPVLYRLTYRWLALHLLVHVLVIAIPSTIGDLVVQLMLLDVLSFARISWWKTTSALTADESVWSA